MMSRLVLWKRLAANETWLIPKSRHLNLSFEHFYSTCVCHRGSQVNDGLLFKFSEDFYYWNWMRYAKKVKHFRFYLVFVFCSLSLSSVFVFASSDWVRALLLQFQRRPKKKTKKKWDYRLQNESYFNIDTLFFVWSAPFSTVLNSSDFICMKY